MREHAIWLLVLGDQGSQPVLPPREMLDSTLAWAIGLARTANRHNLPDHVCGLAAYGAWSNALQVDADYPADSEETLALRLMIHGDQTVMLTERRHAAAYLRQMAKRVPDVEAEHHLIAAAKWYDQAASEESAIWPWGDDMGTVAEQGLADPAARRDIAYHVRLAGQFEAEAVGHLEKALAWL